MPNGYEVFTNFAGKVLKIIRANGDAINTSQYLYAIEGGDLTVSMFDKKIKINLATGLLTVIGSEVVAGHDDAFDLYVDYDEENKRWVVAENSNIITRKSS